MSEKEKKETKKKSDSDVLASVSRRLDKVVKWLEEIHGADIDGDGKIGSAHMGTILLSCVLTIILAVGVGFAEDIANWSSASGLTGTAKLTHDGTAYELEVDNVKVVGNAEGNSVRSIARAGIATADLVVGTTSLGITIPDNAVVWDGYVDVTTAFGATGTTATVALYLNTANDILSETAYTNTFNSAGIKAIVPLGTAATAVKMTADRVLYLVVTGHAYTSGVATVVLEYDELAN